MKVSPLQSNFNGGEFSPLLHGRVDNERYQSGLKKCFNYIPTIQGAVTRRPGTYFANEVKFSTDPTRLVPFEFSITQAYVLEFGDNYIRFYKDNGVIESSPGTPYEIASPYLSTDLAQLKWVQSADVLYLVHPNYPPTQLSRFSDTNWSLTSVTSPSWILNGPYLSDDDRGYTLTPGAATGTGVSLTAGPSVNVSNATNSGGLIRITTAAPHIYETGDRVTIASVGGVPNANGTWIVTVINSTTMDLQGSTFAGAYTSGGTVRPGIFFSTDVNRYVRMREGTIWGYGRIETYTSGAVVTIEILSTLTNVNAKSVWRLGAWSDTTGYPSCVVFHEDRLWFSGAANSPQTIYGSRSGDYVNFAPSDPDGTITNSHAVTFTLNSSDVNVVRWMKSDEKGLLVGTVANEWVVRAASIQEAITPTNVTAKKATSYGSTDIDAVQVGKAAVLVQRSTRKIREFLYFYDVDGFRANDLTILAEHITGEGVTEMAYMREPQSIVWFVRADGALIGMTYERDLDALRAGWHEHQLGGFGDAADGKARVESIAVIPSPDGTRQELWMIVSRFIDGAQVKTVEYMTKLFENTERQEEAFFVDCGLSYDSPLEIEDITQTNPVVVDITAHGLSNGDKIRITEVIGMTEVNDKTFTVANVTTDTFELQGVDGTGYEPYVSGGFVREKVLTISGLGHLEGQEVAILADGAPQPNRTVVSGSITLDQRASIVHVGLPYKSDAQMLRLEAGGTDGTALGKTRRTHRVGMLLYRTLGLKIGYGFDELSPVIFRTSSDLMDSAPPLYSGIISETVDADYDFENEFCWRQEQPLPGTVLAIMPQMVTQNRG